MIVFHGQGLGVPEIDPKCARTWKEKTLPGQLRIDLRDYADSRLGHSNKMFRCPLPDRPIFFSK